MITSITPINTTITIGDTQTLTATVTEAPADSTITYAWSVNGVVQPSATTNKFDYVANSEGYKVIKVVTTAKVEGQADVVNETETSVTVKNKVMNITAVASTTTNTVQVGETYTATCNVSGAPTGAVITYEWSTGETTKDVSATATVEGVISLSCEVTASAPDYDDDIAASNTITINVTAAEPVIPSECPILYIHPLPHRTSAYIWCGWWVMDEIEKLASEGIDWKSAPESSKYQCHLATLAKMLYDYPEVDVQESRNGRIIHKSALEIGVIY